VINKEVEAAKLALQQGNKQKALLALKKKKYQVQLLEKTDQQLMNLEELVRLNCNVHTDYLFFFRRILSSMHWLRSRYLKDSRKVTMC
jgi:hypothetical protein